MYLESKVAMKNAENLKPQEPEKEEEREEQ